MHGRSVVYELDLYRYHFVEAEGLEELVLIVVGFLLGPEVVFCLALDICFDEFSGVVGGLYFEVAYVVLPVDVLYGLAPSVEHLVERGGVNA